MLDIIIIGAGPIGLYGAFYAGMRGMNGAILESSNQYGGQLNLYQEKFIYDIPGFNQIRAKELSQNIFEQYQGYQNLLPLYLNEEIVSVKQNQDNTFLIKTKNNVFNTKTILITSGSGRFIPRKLGLDNESNITNIKYAISDINYYKDKNVAIFGGGDSAVDWALMLEDIAKKVYLIHRRNEFRAHEDSVEKIKKSKVELITPYLARSIMQEKEVKIELENLENQSLKELIIDEVIVNFGTIPSGLGPLADLKLELEENAIKRNSDGSTNIVGIYTAGNAAYYLGRVKTLACGFGEVPVCINSINHYLNPGKNLPFVYSSVKK